MPLTVIFYFLANNIKTTLGKVVIISASIVFYTLGRINMLIYLGMSMLINYCAALIIKKTKYSSLAVFLSVCINIGLLLYFKYLNFALTNINGLFKTSFLSRQIIIPLGISFYTFQQIAYIVTTAKGELKDNSLIDYLVYILFFPKLIMGPLVEPVDFMYQINDERKKQINLSNIAIGLKLFSLGLLKKVLFADTFAKAVSWALTNLYTTTGLDCLLLALFCSFEIYFDFSGYSDMAIGVSKMMNIDLPMNFDSPYKALSIRDFWKRWHISLTKFLTKYIYIPLGGSRKGSVQTYINTLIVFLISGLWHGANRTFVIWGLIHGLLSCFDRMFNKVEEKIAVPIRWFCTFCMVSILWVLFNVETIGQWLHVLKNIFLMQNGIISDEMMMPFNLVENQFIYDTLHLSALSTDFRWLNMFIFILIAFFICLVPENNYRNKGKLTLGSLILASVAFIWGILFLGTESTFVYFGF